MQHIPVFVVATRANHVRICQDQKTQRFFFKKKRGAELKGGNHAASFSHVNAHIWCLFCTPPRLERSSAVPSAPQTVYRLMNDFSFNPLSLPTSGLFPYRMYFFLPLAESWRRALRRTQLRGGVNHRCASVGRDALNKRSPTTRHDL